jgi:thiol-disulfide isomerase/thioredoxin
MDADMPPLTKAGLYSCECKTHYPADLYRRNSKVSTNIKNIFQIRLLIREVYIMKKVFAGFASILLVIMAALPSFGQNSPPSVGGTLPKISLSVPQDEAYKQYLGLKGGGTFNIPQIKASVVIVQIFSMYCPHCQKDAPVANEFFSKLSGDSKLKDTVKLIGIGAGNSDFEIDFFRKQYGIKFPLFSDGDFLVHKAIGEVRTPYFIAIKINKNGTHKVVYSKLGGIENPDEFLKTVKSFSGIK